MKAGGNVDRKGGSIFFVRLAWVPDQAASHKKDIAVRFWDAGKMHLTLSYFKLPIDFK